MDQDESYTFIKQEYLTTIDLLPETNNRVWLPREDEYLLQLIKILQPKKWTHIAKELNKALYNGRQTKSPKQCRERWHNHLNPDLKKGNWTLEEDIYILEQQVAHGNCWSKIAKGLTNRNENNVKNRWNSLVKRYKKTTGRNEFIVHEVLEEKRQQQMGLVPGQSPQYFNSIPVYSPQILMENPSYDAKFQQGYATYNSMSSESLGSTEITHASIGAIGRLPGSFGSVGEVMIDPYTGQPVKAEPASAQQPYGVFVQYPTYQVVNEVTVGPENSREETKLPNVFEASNS